MAAFCRTLPRNFWLWIFLPITVEDGVIPFYLPFAITSPSIFYGCVNVWFCGGDQVWIGVVDLGLMALAVRWIRLHWWWLVRFHRDNGIVVFIV